MNYIKKYLHPLIILIVFEAVAVTLWLSKGHLFYLFNFSYIGLSISLGIFLFIKKLSIRETLSSMPGGPREIYKALDEEQCI